MQTITKKQYDSLTRCIYLKLMESPTNDMDNMAEVREEVFYILENWMDDNGIVLED